ncbi:MAG: hypothetical protein Q9201_007755, partial [Fulgogasparrea decipioides]
PNDHRLPDVAKRNQEIARLLEEIFKLKLLFDEDTYLAALDKLRHQIESEKQNLITRRQLQHSGTFEIPRSSTEMEQISQFDGSVKSWDPTATVAPQSLLLDQTCAELESPNFSSKDPDEDEVALLDLAAREEQNLGAEQSQSLFIAPGTPSAEEETDGLLSPGVPNDDSRGTSPRFLELPAEDRNQDILYPAEDQAAALSSASSSIGAGSKRDLRTQCSTVSDRPSLIGDNFSNAGPSHASATNTPADISSPPEAVDTLVSTCHTPGSNPSDSPSDAIKRDLRARCSTISHALSATGDNFSSANPSHASAINTSADISSPPEAVDTLASTCHTPSGSSSSDNPPDAVNASNYISTGDDRLNASNVPGESSGTVQSTNYISFTPFGISPTASTSNTPPITLAELVRQAQDTFKQTAIDLNLDYRVETIRETEVHGYFSQFLPEKWLTTSAINPIISSFEWDTKTLVLHSSLLDVDDVINRSALTHRPPWPIEGHHQQIILPSCFKGHWTLFHIDLSQQLRSPQQSNGSDCGLFTILNAERYSLSPPSDGLEITGLALRQHYLNTLLKFALRNMHDLKFQRMVLDERRPERIKRAYSPDEHVAPQISKKARHVEWEPSIGMGIQSQEDWEGVRNALAKEIQNHSNDDLGNQRRAEHLLRMISAIAGQEVMTAWKSLPSDEGGLRNRSGSSVAFSIYSMLSRGQTRSYRDNVILRVGKYLFASRIANQVERFRSQGPPSKQRVSIAGSTGEGNAVTRALRQFLNEVYGATGRDPEESEVRKCKQWWSEGKIWRLLAGAVDPAILLLIPSGHRSFDKERIWDSE